MVDRGGSSRYSDDEPQRERGYEDDEPRKPKIDRQVLIAIGILAVCVVALFMWVNNSMVSKKDFSTNVDNILADMGTMQTSLNTFQDSVKTIGNLNTQVSQVADKVNTLTNEIASVKSGLDKYAKTDSLSQTNTNLTNIQNNLNTLQSQVNNLKQVDTSSLSASIETLKTQVTTLETKVNELSISGSGSSSGDTSVSIPNFSVDVRVVDEGTLQSSDNSTIGQIKITLTNSGSRDIEDLVVYLFVCFDDCYLANQSVSAREGTWSVRERQRDEIQLKGRISRINDGETHRIYLDIKSFANDYWEGGRVTYLDVSTSDLEIVDWNYES